MNAQSTVAAAAPEIAGRDLPTKLRNVQRQLGTAKTDFDSAALRCAKGEIDQETLAGAQAAILSLEAQEVMLKAAIREAGRAAQAEDRKAEAAAMAAAAVEAEKAADDMRRAWGEIVDGIAALAPKCAEFRDARGRIAGIVNGYRSAFANMEQVGDLRRTIVNDLSRERWLLEGKLAAAGFAEFGVGDDQAHREVGHADPEHALVFKERAIAEILSALRRASEKEQN